MAGAVITDVTLIDSADTATGWVGTSGGLDTEVFIQGGGTPGSWTYQTSKNARSSATFTPAAAIDMSTTNDHLYWWHRCDVMPFTETKVLGTTVASGLTVRVESSATDYVEWHVSGSDVWRGEWKRFILDINNANNNATTGDIYASGGTLNLATVTVITWFIDNSNSGQIRIIDNTWLDAVYFGRGLIGTSATTEAFDFNDIAIIDESLANMYGILQKTDGVLFCQGQITIGDAGDTAQTNFISINETLYFFDRLVSSDLYGIFASEATAATNPTDISITGMVTKSVGSAANIDFSDPDINSLGIESSTFLDMGTFSQATGTIDTSSFNGCGTTTLAAAITTTSCTWLASNQIIQSGATITSCTIDSSIANTGSPLPEVAALLSDNLGLITNCTFLSGIVGSPFTSGHAIEIDTTGTYTFTGNTFTGYGADDTVDAVIYNTSGGLVTINVVGGDTPTVRNAVGSPVSTTVVNNSVTILVQGVTEGAAVKVVANETVGTITIGDVILEALVDTNGEATSAINYEGAFEPSGLDVIVRARSSGLPTAAIQDDNGIFTDETTAANSAVSADMHLLPTTPIVNEDRYLFGHLEMFNNMKIDINTAGTGGFTITWQYWNGAWTNLTGVVDDTNSFSILGKSKVSFTMPGDWTTTTINGQGPYYYIRAAYAAGTVTVVPLGTRCTLDVTKYLPFVQNGTITSTGLTVTASWNEDTIATF